MFDVCTTLNGIAAVYIPIYYMKLRRATEYIIATFFQADGAAGGFAVLLQERRRPFADAAA